MAHRAFAAAAFVVLLTGGATAATLNHATFTAASNVQGSSMLGPTAQTATSLTFEDANSRRQAASAGTYSGDFTFAGNWRAITRDNDIMGVNFGYVDGQNNYRLGWEGGGFWDTETGTSVSGANGLFLIAEENGVSTVLFEAPTLFWTLETQYSFNIELTGNSIIFGVFQGTTQLAGATVAKTRSTDGRLGAYANSQSAFFEGLSSSVDADEVPDDNELAPVPLPAGLPLLALGLGALGFIRRRNRRAAD